MKIIYTWMFKGTINGEEDNYIFHHNKERGTVKFNIYNIVNVLFPLLNERCCWSSFVSILSNLGMKTTLSKIRFFLNSIK